MNNRSAEARAYRHLYKTAQWQRLRDWVLNQNPLCVFCQRQGRIEAATVVDHIKPHKGDRTLFYDSKNLQGLCSPHHDSDKQAEERRGYSNEIGIDGRPVDPRNPGFN